VPQITLKKTWLSASRRSLETSMTSDLRMANMLLNMKNLLVSVGWSVTQSSNSTVLGTGLGDYWNVPTDVVYGIAGTAHSWVVLQNAVFMPGFEFMLDRGPTTYVVEYYTIKVRACAQGYNTNGTHLVSPTAKGPEVLRDDFNFCDLPTDCRGTTMLYSSDSQCFRLFNTHQGYCGDNYGYFGAYGGAAITLERPVNVNAAWTDPFVLMAFNAVTGVGRGGGGGWSYNQAQSYRYSLTVINSKVVNLSLSVLMGDTRWVGRTPLTNGVDAKGASLLYPVFLNGYSNGMFGVLGRVADLYMAPVSHIACFRYPTVGNPLGLIRMGCLATGAPNGIVKVF